jgi:hypothetical protein
MLFLPLRGCGAAGVWLNGPDEAGHILTYNSVERTTYPIYSMNVAEKLMNKPMSGIA